MLRSYRESNKGKRAIMAENINKADRIAYPFPGKGNPDFRMWMTKEEANDYLVGLARGIDADGIKSSPVVGALTRKAIGYQYESMQPSDIVQALESDTFPVSFKIQRDARTAAQNVRGAASQETLDKRADDDKALDRYVRQREYLQVAHAIETMLACRAVNGLLTVKHNRIRMAYVRSAAQVIERFLRVGDTDKREQERTYRAPEETTAAAHLVAMAKRAERKAQRDKAAPADALEELAAMAA